MGNDNKKNMQLGDLARAKQALTDLDFQDARLTRDIKDTNSLLPIIAIYEDIRNTVEAKIGQLKINSKDCETVYQSTMNDAVIKDLLSTHDKLTATINHYSALHAGRNEENNKRLISLGATREMYEARRNKIAEKLEEEITTDN